MIGRMTAASGADEVASGSTLRKLRFQMIDDSLFPGEQLTSELIFEPRAKLMPETQVVLEVKSNNGVPRWAEEGARVAELVQIPVPKYVMAVEKLGIDRVPLMETSR
jgi:hypothetical protein